MIEITEVLDVYSGCLCDKYHDYLTCLDLKFKTFIIKKLLLLLLLSCKIFCANFHEKNF